MINSFNNISYFKLTSAGSIAIIVFSIFHSLHVYLFFFPLSCSNWASFNHICWHVLANHIWIRKPSQGFVETFKILPIIFPSLFILVQHPFSVERYSNSVCNKKTQNLPSYNESIFVSMPVGCPSMKYCIWYPNGFFTMCSLVCYAEFLYLHAHNNSHYSVLSLIFFWMFSQRACLNLSDPTYNLINKSWIRGSPFDSYQNPYPLW